MIQFEEFCQKEKLYYTLAGGTLLGAIRHKGFIPWDDDIDVMMPREEYNRLINLLDSKKICDFIDILKPGDEGYYYPFMKAYDNRTIAQMEDNDSKHGIWIDIFPADNLPEDVNELKKLFKRTRFWRATVISMTTNLAGERNLKKKVVKALLKAFGKVIGTDKVVQRADKAAQKYNNVDSDYLGVAIWGYGPGERMLKKEYFVEYPVVFENRNFQAPGCWKEYLEGLYGDFMQLPPEEKRKTHHLKAWKISE